MNNSYKYLTSYSVMSTIVHFTTKNIIPYMLYKAKVRAHSSDIAVVLLL